MKSLEARFSKQNGNGSVNKPYLIYCNMDGIIAGYIHDRIVPYLIKNKLPVKGNISINRCLEITGIDSEKFLRILRDGTIKNTEYNWENSTLNGIDLAIYVLKKTKKSLFKRKDIAELFNVEEIDLLPFGFCAPEHKSYSKPKKVFPFYDKVSGIARDLITGKKFDKKRLTLTPIHAKDRCYYLSINAKLTYCDSYGLDEFDSLSIKHIKENLAKGQFNARKCISPEMTFTLTRNKIVSIALHTNGINEFKDVEEGIDDFKIGRADIEVIANPFLKGRVY